ncbi:MAG TPA: response regulator [Burkholderiales bacterium]|nr:response regulator [Burkholderiales bacterium]
MKRKPATGAGIDAGSAKRLRQKAEEIARQAPAPLEDPGALGPADLQRLIHDLQVHEIELELQNEELRRAHHALEASRARYFDLFDMAPAGYVTLNESGVILEANLTIASLLGVARGALIQKHLGRFVVRDDADRFYLRCKETFSNGSPQSFELDMLRTDGPPFTAWIDASLARGDDATALCRLVISDISDRKATEEALRRSQRLLQTAGRIAQVGGWAIRLPQDELLWSDETFPIFDYPRGNAPSLAEALSLCVPASREIVSAALLACGRDGTPFDCELEIVTPKRRRLCVRAIGLPVRDAAGNIAGIEGAVQDITVNRDGEQTRTALEAQLRESQKMEAIGTLAGGIAHDFNNILGIILGNIELARQDSAANRKALVSLEEIEKAGSRARDLVQQILSFSRRQPVTRRVMSLPPVVEETVRLLRAALPGGPRIEYRVASDTPSVAADPTQVQQVLVNLGTNAAQAMEGRAGVIDIRVDGIRLDRALTHRGPRLPPGRYAHITVGDSGCGMDAATLRRIFEPFFTTKSPGEGTGLGLAVAHGIMQAHHGAIDVHSEPGKGSRFELYFPVAGVLTEVSVAIEAASAASEGGGRHVLYIEDDDSQRFLMKRLLERWGYRVSAFAEQRSALDALHTGERIDLMITDFNMPGMSGLEVARAALEVRPDLPVILVSGYITDAVRTAATAAGASEVLPKPLDMEELRDTMQRLTPPPETVGGERA